jgi:hypothetical protein
MMLSLLLVVEIYRLIESALSTFGSFSPSPLLQLTDGIRNSHSIDSYHRGDLISEQCLRREIFA